MADPIRIGLLGAGWFGREAHLKNLLRLEDVEVVAASSRSSESRQAARELVGAQLQTSDDWRDVVARDDLDAMIVALTNDQHHAATRMAFERGLHVLCEKPLGLSIAECDDLLSAADTAKRVLQVGHEMRFQKLYQQMHHMLTGNVIGTPHILWCREYRGPMRPGWRGSDRLTGGMILEKNSHHFDLFQWMFQSEPMRVLATGGRNVLLDREVLDNAQVLVEFHGGHRAVLEVCLFAPSGGDCEIGAVGTQGRIDTWNQALRLMHHDFATGESRELEVLDDEEEAGFQDAAGRIDRGIRAELQHFIECCRTGQTPLTDGGSARMSVAMCLAAQESIRREEAVSIDELLETSGT